MRQQRGKVYLVGGGPGDPGLITVRGMALLRAADVVVHDRLIARELLTQIRPEAEVVYAGKARGQKRLSQEQIEALLVDRAKRGLMVVRLKGGDPFIFGRGFEELSACRAAGVACVVIPGVSSAYAGPLAAGIPITERRVVRSFAVVTGTIAADSEARSLDYKALAAVDTLVVLMGLLKLDEIAAGLMAAGRDASTPTACVEWATTPEQRVTVASLSTIVDEAARDGLEPPVVVVIGEVAARAKTEGFGAIGPLAGKRVVVTKPRRRHDALVAGLTVAGANVVVCPLVKAAYPDVPAQLDAALADLDPYDWLVFPSEHAVCGLRRRLDAAGMDARALAGCKVAAGTAAAGRALRRLGLTPDLGPGDGDRRAAIEAFAPLIAEQRALYLGSDVGHDGAIRTLRDAGANVTAVEAYRYVPAAVSPATLGVLRRGVDAVVFTGPMAVRGFVELKACDRLGAVVCGGASTAAAARDLRLDATVELPTRAGASLVQAVVDHFQTARLPT